MASITVDVSLDDFDLDEILEEIEDRYNYRNGKNKKQIEEWAEDFFGINEFQSELSVIDQMKVDFFMQNLHKIKLNDLENLI